MMLGADALKPIRATNDIEMIFSLPMPSDASRERSACKYDGHTHTHTLVHTRRFQRKKSIQLSGYAYTYKYPP